VPAAQTAPGPPKARNPSHKNLSQPQLQPWGGAGTPKARWNKPTYTVSSDDPCTICHDELRGDSCALQCGHCFHKECIQRWLKQHSSTCPICRTHAVLPEDFPELPPRNRH
ncbi:DZIP3 ligase, partial [Alcedo cyanopectus]|nr:DZIP3 ligase [Ceyx cyanopectus]